jgi:lipid-binding SYLF domain-containing protein
MLSTKFQLGADASVAAGPVGAGAQAATVDILAFSRNQGLFGGLTIEGAVIASRDKWSSIYYGQSVRPVDILIRRDVSNVNATALRRTLTDVAGDG